LGNKKSPDLAGAGLRFEMMRPFDYARAPPEPRKGLMVFVVVFADVIMGPGP
jgi:hypothetical protein